MTDLTCDIDGCEKAAAKRDGKCSMHRARIARHGGPDGKAKRPSLIERMLAKLVMRDSGCWEWTGYRNALGYGLLRVDDRGNVNVHKAVYELFIGPVPDGLVLDHVCHNPPCANPEHLRPVTRKQNVENYTRMNRANTSGARGVSFHRASGLWHARVRHAGRTYSAGYYHSVAEAAVAAMEMRNSLHTHNDRDRASSTR